MLATRPSNRTACRVSQNLSRGCRCSPTTAPASLAQEISPYAPIHFELLLLDSSFFRSSTVRAAYLSSSACRGTSFFSCCSWQSARVLAEPPPSQRMSEKQHPAVQQQTAPLLLNMNLPSRYP